MTGEVADLEGIFSLLKISLNSRAHEMRASPAGADFPDGAGGSLDGIRSGMGGTGNAGERGEFPLSCAHKSNRWEPWKRKETG